MASVDLFIPTYNRPLFLKRIVDYYLEYGRFLNIYVVDSSSTKIKEINKEYIRSLNNKKIRYIDKYSSEKTQAHKIFGMMTRYAKSKYFVMCADDDFIIPNGIKKAVEFLENNPEYIAAHGTYISFYLHKLTEFWWKFIYPYKSITDNKAEQRLIKHLKNYYQVLYAVRRTKDVQKAYKEFLKSGAEPFIFGELLPDMLTLVYGKMKRLPILYAMRQAFSSAGGKWPTLKDYIDNGKYEKEYLCFKTTIAKNISQHSDISNHIAEKLIDDAMPIYLKNYYPEHYVIKAQLFIDKFPNLIKDNIRLLYTRYIFSKDQKDIIGKVDSPRSNFFMDFERVKKQVLEYV